MKSVLFVCLGNICRSPAAEGVFRKLVAEAGRAAEFEIDSAGTGAWHVGSAADHRMRAAAERRGYRLDSIARQIVPTDFDRFGLILTMDDLVYENVTALRSRAPGRIERMVRYCSLHEVDEVPDPYYGGEEGFEEVLDILEDACAGLLRQL
jgi:protein-tyrosine phosphatase